MTKQHPRLPAFGKVLVANRSEIAVRAMRAAVELGARTVAVYPWEDRHSEHRIKADEAWEIGTRGKPVGAYLSAPAIVATAVRAGADAIYPGYGFLAENAELAQECARNGVTFVGPSAEVLKLTGDKAAAVAAARRAGLPTLASTRPSSDVEQLLAASVSMPFPVFVKAVAGGGGRGMRLVADAASLPGAIEACKREASAAFGDDRVFVEQAVVAPRHIEVQVLADASGEIVHLHERDCSVQRRHQKVVEIAPAPGLDPGLRERLCADAVRFAREIGYRNAGTVEFLVDREGRHWFIEMNPRIQVEHTVTEEVTGVDLVQAQLQIAAGHTLAELGIRQEDITPNGFAIQCRVTTEDPADGFKPARGVISAYRSPGGRGVRVDAGNVFPGAVVSPYFDSMLLKVTCHGRDFDVALARASRALAETRVRGVATNVTFLRAVLEHPDFRAGADTSFIASRPELMRESSGDDRGTKLLAYLADVTVNRPHGRSPGRPSVSVRSGWDLATPPPAGEGSRSRLLALGPEGFAAELRARRGVAVTDTTFRDAHQSLLATRVRTRDLVAGARQTVQALPGLWSLECWGGATFDACLRFLAEDPWQRLDRLREAAPDTCLQMLLRGRNTVGYTAYPTEVTTAFVTEAARSGIDVFRIFDALNDVDQMVPAIEAVRRTETAVAEVALCYTGNLADPSESRYTLDYYLRLAERAVSAGAHVLAIKDMAGLLRPAAARMLVTALRGRFEVPVHLHTHDTAGGQAATLLAAVDAGVDAVDLASAPFAGSTSQPSMASLVAALDGTPRTTGLSLDAVCDLEPFWEGVRQVYGPFESGTGAPSGRVYRHEIPGGQITNLRQQALALGLGDRFGDVERMYAEANRILGNIVKVTPSSKVVGDLALHLAAVRADPADFEARPDAYDLPESVVGMLNGDLGTPPDGWPEPFRTRALGDRARAQASVGLGERDADLLGERPRETLNRLLFPGPWASFEQTRSQYGDLSVLDSRLFFYGLEPGEECAVDVEPGKTMIVSIQAVGEPDERGSRPVWAALNGQARLFRTIDRSSSRSGRVRERADASEPGHVAAPFAGAVSVAVKVGDVVEVGDPVATIEAMKMEAPITTPVAGTVVRVIVAEQTEVEGGDLVVVVA